MHLRSCAIDCFNGASVLALYEHCHDMKNLELVKLRQNLLCCQY